MTALQDWVAVGAPSRVPGSPMTLVRHPAGALHLAISFREELRDHPMLHAGMQQVVSFSEDPGVPGIAPLVHWDRASATFIYPMTRGVLLSDIVHARRFHRGPHPPKAGLELLITAGQLLDPGAVRGATVGLVSHGALDPWRLVVHSHEAVSLLGYGLPAVDVMAWLDEETDLLPSAALRYFPPERIEDAAEDVRGDVYALALCASELIFGRPLLEGDAREVVDAILDGEIERRISAVHDGLDPAVRDLLISCVVRDPARRITSGEELVRRAHALWKVSEGPSLFELARPLMDTEGADPFADMAAEEDVKTEIMEARPTTTPGRAISSAYADDQITKPIRLTVDAPPTSIPAPRAPISQTPPPPPRPDAPANTLEEIQATGPLILEGVNHMVQQANVLAKRVVDAAHSGALHAEFVRRAQDAAERANRAAAAVEQAVELLQQDDDLAAARITLDLVQNAETQCAQALQEVTQQLKAVEQYAERDASRKKALSDAVRRAAEHGQVANDAAAQADELVTELESVHAAGGLSTQGCGVAIDQASASAELAHRHADEAMQHAEKSRGAERVELALRHAEAASRAERRAILSLEDTQVAAEHARRLEAQARAAAISDARGASTAARLALEEAKRALDRAEEFAKLAPERAADATRALTLVRKGVAASDVAATLTAQVAKGSGRTDQRGGCRG